MKRATGRLGGGHTHNTREIQIKNLVQIGPGSRCAVVT